MGSGWRRARRALGLKCVSAQPEQDELPLGGDSASCDVGSVDEPCTPVTGTPSRLFSPFSLIRNSGRAARSTCAICLETMKAGQGQALFTAECAHAFHFSCIASNVRHGNLVCPVCRAVWKEVPWHAPAEHAHAHLDHVHRHRTRSRNRLPGSPLRSPGRGEVDPDDEEEQRARPDPVIRILDESIANARGHRRTVPQEPSLFDDDEPLSPPTSDEATPPPSTDEQNGEASGQSTMNLDLNLDLFKENEGEAVKIENNADIVVTCHPEVSAVAASEERGSFTVLVHLKSSATKKKKKWQGPKREPCLVVGSETYGEQVLDPSCRAPIDLVTVLDISGSMAGTKLVLLKRAMAFVIRNLSPADRLSVVAFSSSARRLFPLRRMVEDGRRHALRCVDSLVSTGGTNIADGLRKGAKMLDERRMKNPVSSIMLLSDGQDTYTIGNRGQVSGLAAPRSSSNGSSTDFRRLLPGSMGRGTGEAQVPVHTFGFGADHDAATMHCISEVSGGTFSFIQTEGVVQDAFAQCIGGLLSVVTQDTTLTVSTAALGVQVKSVQAGSYETSISDDGSQAEVKLGDLYAEEERDVLLDLKLPAVRQMSSSEDLSMLLRVGCSFRDPVSTSMCQTRTAEVRVARPQVVDAGLQFVSLDVDRQRNRVRIAQSILEAGNLADSGEISSAQQILVRAGNSLHRSAAFQAGDALSIGLDSELAEIQLRVANRQVYERTGRAYILSAQSSHFHQRATTRGDFAENHSREYQTSSMADMVHRSQTLPPTRSSASGSTTPGRDREIQRSSTMSLSPTRLLLRRTSGKVQDSHGHRDSSP